MKKVNVKDSKNNDTYPILFDWQKEMIQWALDKAISISAKKRNSSIEAVSMVHSDDN